MGRLDGKSALVTGASRGIGEAIALELAREGAKVAVHYRTGEAEARAVLDEITAAGGEAVLVQADVSQAAQARALVQQVVDQYGRLDILVNNAGMTRDRTMRKMNDEDWETVIATNLNSVFYCTSAAMPKMIEQQYGRIINISSFVGQAGNFGQANYAASKGGVIAFTKTAALELGRYNITVNTVAPGFTETDMVAKIPEDVQKQLLAKIPLGRFAKPAEIARTVVFLAADGDYITGAQINVNGGVYM
jgi:acetoacetyl-CoA reductase